MNSLRNEQIRITSTVYLLSSVWQRSLRKFLVNLQYCLRSLQDLLNAGRELNNLDPHSWNVFVSRGLIRVTVE